MSDYVIMRDCMDLVAGEDGALVSRHQRVYVVGPLWGVDPMVGSYSSTPDATQASMFDLDTARRLLRSGKWYGSNPAVVEAPRQ